MNNFKEIKPDMIKKNPFQAIGKDWMLVTAGNTEKMNAMTASWGGLGVMFGKNVAFTVIRPQRYTKEFIDREESFSLCFFDKKYRNVLNYFGTVSGRDEDKIANSGLTTAFYDNTPYFAEANTVLICKKLFVQPLDKNTLIDDKIASWYPQKDYHTLYISEIVNVLQECRPK